MARVKQIKDEKEDSLLNAKNKKFIRDKIKEGINESKLTNKNIQKYNIVIETNRVINESIIVDKQVKEINFKS